MKISLKNGDEVEAALAKVNGNAVKHTVVRISRLLDLTNRVNERLARDGIFTGRDGAIITYRPKGPYALDYRFTTVTTAIELTIGEDGRSYFLTDVQRADVRDQHEIFRIKLRAETFRYFIDCAQARYDIITA